MKLLYVRSGPYELNFDSYNLQEVGLAKAFCEKGIDIDILYYSKENRNQEIKYSGHTINILWRKGIKLLRTGIYPSILNKSFLSQYDYVIASEYSQIMSVLLLLLHDNVFIYNGPYYNLFKIPFMEKIYDRLFSSFINNRAKKIFCKTNMSAEYLLKKRINNTKVIGVGLDTQKLDIVTSINSDTLQILNQLEGYYNILFVGSIIARKNIAFLFKTFNQLKKLNKEKKIQLIVVGKGDPKYLDYCYSLLDLEVRKSVRHYDFIDNTQLKYIYQFADLFLLTSTQEIFGMVLLEAMYNGLVTISSYNAGSNTLIVNGENGFVINSFDCNEWVSCIENILFDENKKKYMGNNANKTIVENFLWNRIVDLIINEFN